MSEMTNTTDTPPHVNTSRAARRWRYPEGTTTPMSQKEMRRLIDADKPRPFSPKELMDRAIARGRHHEPNWPPVYVPNPNKPKVKKTKDGRRLKKKVHPDHNSRMEKTDTLEFRYGLYRDRMIGIRPTYASSAKVNGRVIKVRPVSVNSESDKQWVETEKALRKKFFEDAMKAVH